MTLRDVLGDAGGRRPARRGHGPRLRQPRRHAGDALLLRARLHARRPRLRPRRRRARRGRARRRAPARPRRARGRRAERPRARWRPRPRASTAIPPRRCARSASPARTARRRRAFLLRALLEAGGRRTGLLGTVTAVVGGATATRSRARRRRRSTSSAPSARCSTPATRRSSWRSPRTRWRWAAPTRSTGRRRSSRTSRRTTSTSTRRWRTTSRPSGGCCARPTGARIVNVDDAYGRRLAEELPGAITVGIDSAGRAAAGDRRRGRRRPARASPWTASSWPSPLPGRFNVLNALGARGRGPGARRRPTTSSPPRCPRADRAPGRFEPVDEGQGFAVLVDYAHTPDSLDNVLRAARGLGRRARRRRVRLRRRPRPRQAPADGRASARDRADVVIVTSDNPRSEDPEQIIERGPARAPARAPRRCPTAARRSSGRSAWPSPATSSSSPARATSAARRSPAACKLPFDDVDVARAALRGAPA